MSTFDYEVAFSFAGEDRHRVAPIAKSLQAKGVSVFYDEFEQAALWGKDLYAHLSHLYSKKARFCVVVISTHYASKAWTKHELQNAQARAFQENSEYILPLRLDATEIPGIPATIGYLDLTRYSTESIVDLILQKLDQSDRSTRELRQTTASASFPKIPLPKVRKTFTQREKDQFAQEAFSYIMHYFEEALKQFKASDADIDTDFLPVHRQKFACKVYVKGEVANQCKLWLGSWTGHGNTQINLATGRRIDLDRDNSINETVSIVDDGHQLGLKLAGFQNFGPPKGGVPSKEEAAEHLWKHFTESFSH